MSSTDKKVLFTIGLISLGCALMAGGLVFGGVFVALIALVVASAMGLGSLCGLGKIVEFAQRKEFWEGFGEGLRERSTEDQAIFQKVIKIVEFVITLFPAPAAQETTKPAPEEPEEDEFW
jgi:hypothetical protein